MAGIRTKTWITEDGKRKKCFEITYYYQGKQCRKSGFKTKNEAQEAIPVITKSFSNTITIKVLAELYIDNRILIGKCKESTAQLYKGYLNYNLKAIQNMQARKITPYDYNNLIQVWKNNGLSNKSINNIIKFVRSIYSYAIKNKWISENPVLNVDTLPNVKPPIKYLTEKEMVQFLNVIEQFPTMQKTALYTAMFTGMRISELLALEWSDIDFKKNTIRVNKQYYKNNLTTPKTYKSTRTIFIMPEVIKQLGKLKKESKVLSKIVFCGRSGFYINQNKFVHNYFKKAVKMIGKPNYNFHCLRHTYASYMLSLGDKYLKFVQEQLGHSTPITTLNIYTHLMPSVAPQAIKEMESFELRRKNLI